MIHTQYLFSFQVTVVPGEGTNVNRDLRCWCDEGYPCLGGRSSSFPGRLSGEAEEAPTSLREQSGWLRSPRPWRGLYLPKRAGATWEVGNEGDYSHPDRTNNSFPPTSWRMYHLWGILEGSRKVASGCAPLAHGVVGRK